MKPIAVQLYSLRDEMAKNPVATIKKVAAMGYKGVEPAGFGGLAPDEFRKVVEGEGMVVCSTHGPGASLDDLPGTVGVLRELGVDFVIHGGLPGRLTEMAKVEKVAKETNSIIAGFAAEGVSTAMHNHDHEFSLVDGTPAFDLFMDSCPEMRTEMDIYWVCVGGVDAPEYVAKYSSRLPFMHVKDGPVEQGKPMTAVGKGKVPVAECINAADENVLRWLIVELDEADGDMTRAIQDSYDFLTSNGLAEGSK